MLGSVSEEMMGLSSSRSAFTRGSPFFISSGASAQPLRPGKSIDKIMRRKLNAHTIGEV